MRKTIVIMLFLGCLFSCKSPPPPPPPIIINPLVIQEIAPLPRSVVVKQVVEYEPIFSVLKIIEVSEVNGVQKFFIVKLSQDRTGIAVGVKGEIAEDEAFQKIIGTYRIIELYGDFIKAEIESLNYKIGPVAWMKYKIGEKLKGVD